MRLFQLTTTRVPGIGSAASWAIDAYHQKLTLQGVKFRVQCDKAASENALPVASSGLEFDNARIRTRVDGTVTGAEVAELNADGSPQLYVCVNSAGSGTYWSLAAWSAGQKKSLSTISLPERAENPVNGMGYMGHDELVVAEQYLVRSSPVYREGDSNAAPGGGI